MSVPIQVHVLDENEELVWSYTARVGVYYDGSVEFQVRSFLVSIKKALMFPGETGYARAIRDGSQTVSLETIIEKGRFVRIYTPNNESFRTFRVDIKGYVDSIIEPEKETKNEH